MILVTRAEKPIITISGTSDIARNEFNYTRGVKMFQNVQIISQTRKEAEELDDDVCFVVTLSTWRKYNTAIVTNVRFKLGIVIYDEYQSLDPECTVQGCFNQPVPPGFVHHQICSQSTESGWGAPKSARKLDGWPGTGIHRQRRWTCHLW